MILSQSRVTILKLFCLLFTIQQDPAKVSTAVHGALSSSYFCFCTSTSKNAQYANSTHTACYGFNVIEYIMLRMSSYRRNQCGIFDVQCTTLTSFGMECTIDISVQSKVFLQGMGKCRTNAADFVWNKCLEEVDRSMCRQPCSMLQLVFGHCSKHVAYATGFNV